VQNGNGTVTIHYEARDIDTAGGTPINQDHVHPMFEYWNGSSFQTMTTLAAGDTDPVAVNHDGSWNGVVHTATWTPTADYNNHFQNNTAKVRVTVSDNEGANPTGSAESATYSLDTLSPSGASVSVDASTAPNPTIHLAETEDNPGRCRRPIRPWQAQVLILLAPPKPILLFPKARRCMQNLRMHILMLQAL
jgi:hypothetical protein